MVGCTFDSYPSPEIILKVWDEKNELARERIEQEQRVAEDHT